MPRTTRNTRSNNVDNDEMPLRVTRRAYRSRVPTAGDRNLQVVEESNNENAMQ